MADKRYTEDEIWAAVVAQIDTGSVPWKGEAVANGVISRLTRSELAPDVVVTYETGGETFVSRASDALGIIDGTGTNIMPHYPEDKVMEWAAKFSAFDIPDDDAGDWWRAKMDAFKYRREG